MRIKKFNVAFLIVLSTLVMTPFVRSVQLATDAAEPEYQGKDTPASQEEPTYRGRSLSELTAALKDKDFQVRIRAVYSLGYMEASAKPAVPALVDALNQEQMRESVLHALGNIGVGAEEAIPALIKAIAEYAPACRWSAAEALAKIGVAAVPSLKEATRSENIYLRIWSNAALAKNEATSSPHLRYLAVAMESKDKRMSNEALRAMRMLGRKSEPLIPELIEAMTTPKISPALVAQALAGIGPDAKPAVPVLVKALQDKNDSVRLEVVRALAAIGPEAEPAVSLLTEMIQEKNERMRAEVAKALGQIGLGASPAITVLIPALKDKDEWVRTNAAEAIGKIDPTNLKPVPTLIEAMKDESGRVRGAVAQTLLKIGPVNKQVVLAFILALEDNYKSVIYAADEFFHLVGRERRDVVPELIELLKDPGERAIRSAIIALENMGADAEPAVPTLVEAMRNPNTLCLAEGALIKLGPKAKSAVPELIRMLDDEDRAVCQSAARVLASIGPDARGAIPALVSCLEKKIDPWGKLSLCTSLAALDLKSKEVIAALTQLTKDKYAPVQPGAHYELIRMKHDKELHFQALLVALEVPDARVRLYAAGCLGELKGVVTEAIPSLQKRLEDNNPEVRVAAAHAILLISSKQSDRKEAVDVIIKSLGEEEFMARLRAASALEPFGPGERWTVPVLITKVYNDDMPTRMAAIEALGNIGTAAREALPSLRHLLKDEHWKIRQSAAKAIKKIER